MGETSLERQASSDLPQQGHFPRPSSRSYAAFWRLASQTAAKVMETTNANKTPATMLICCKVDREFIALPTRKTKTMSHYNFSPQIERTCRKFIRKGPRSNVG